MVGSAVTLQTGSVIRNALTSFLERVITALPELIAGAVFLLLAAVAVKLVLALVKAFLRRTLPGESPVYRQFLTTIVAVFLWFGVALSFLSIVGLQAIAAALGTATGFLALGVSYALSGMIADAVAGVYLLRDPDFNPGDRVDIGGIVGIVKTIELRKTRINVDGDTLVRGNAEIEKKWTKLNPDDDRAKSLDNAE